MKSKILFLFAFLFANLFSFGQSNCGSPFQELDTTIPLKTTDFLQNYCVNVYFHIVRNSNGQGGINTNKLEDIIYHLNSVFEEHRISFIKMDVDFIDNSSFVALSENEYESLTNTNRFEQALNYYIVDTMWGSVYGAAYLRTNALVVSKNFVTTMVSPHEVGHSLGLYHTYQGTASGSPGCAETTNGSDCETCGDRICDTPADANIGQTGGYNPDMHNIMSGYSNKQHFTTGQGERMKENLSSYYALSNMLSKACADSNFEKPLSPDFNIYPIPTKGNLFIKTDTQESFSANVKVIDLSRNTKIEQNTNQATTNLDLSSLPTGVYIVKIKTATETKVKQIIKN